MSSNTIAAAPAAASALKLRRPEDVFHVAMALGIAAAGFVGFAPTY
jgi:hypothetical protein